MKVNAVPPKKPEQLYTIKTPSKDADHETETNWIDTIGIFAKTREGLTLWEIYHMARQMYETSQETAKQQLKLKYCLYTLLLTFTLVCVALLVVFYALSMTTLAISFLGPLVTGLIGLIVVLVSGRKK